MSLSAFLNKLAPIKAPRPDLSEEDEFEMLSDDGFLFVTPSARIPISDGGYSQKYYQPAPPPPPKKRRPFIYRVVVKCKKVLRFDCEPKVIIVGFQNPN